MRCRMTDLISQNYHPVIDGPPKDNSIHTWPGIHHPILLLFLFLFLFLTLPPLEDLQMSCLHLYCHLFDVCEMEHTSVTGTVVPITNCIRPPNASNPSVRPKTLLLGCDCFGMLAQEREEEGRLAPSEPLTWESPDRH
jgi:hypothetical protein